MKKKVSPFLCFLLLSFLWTNAQTTEWNFTSDAEGWEFFSNLTGSVSGGYLNYTITGTNPAIRYTYPAEQFLNSSSHKYLRIKFKNNTTVTTGRITWLNNNTVQGQKDFTIIRSAGQYAEYLVDLSAVAAWTGSTTINRLYFFLPFFSPTSGQTISIDYIKFDTVPPPAPARKIGAIRWDGWAGDSSSVGLAVEKTLGPNQWHYRLPFFATEVSTDSVNINGNSQAIMDQEINYAANAGLDYWAFNMYKTNDPLYYGIGRYLSSSVRNKLKFSLIVVPDYFRDTAALTQIKSLVQESGYLTVLNGRPVLYLLNTSWATIVNSFGGHIQNFRAALDNFRTFCTGAGLQTPYIIIMDPNPVLARAYTDSLGTDAITSYNSINTLTDTAGTYNALVSPIHGVESFWNTCKSTGSQVVPILMAGWDRRPRVQNPVPWEASQVPGVGMNLYYEQPTPAELTAHFKQGENWLDSNSLYSQANLAIAYAWNENDEGGYLVPTLFDGSARLDSLKRLLNPDTTAPTVAKPPIVEGRASKSLQRQNGTVADLRVYTAPNSDEVILTIQSPETVAATVQLYDMKGTLHKTLLVSLQKGQNRVNIKDNGLSNGIYIVSLKASSFQLSQQFLK